MTVPAQYEREPPSSAPEPENPEAFPPFTPLRCKRFLFRTLLASSRIGLHAARICSGSQPTLMAGGGGQATLRPIIADLDNMSAPAQILDHLRCDTALINKNARPRETRPERRRKMFGVPGRRIDRLLQIVSGMDVTKQKLGRPLALLITAGRAPGKIRLAVTHRHGWGKSRARTLARLQRSRMLLVQPEHLRACAEAQAKLRNDRRRLQPSARRWHRDHVAVAIDDVEMHGVATLGADPPDRRLAGAESRHRLARTAFAHADGLAESGNGAGQKLHRRLVGNQLAPLGVVGFRQQLRDRNLAEVRIAVAHVAIGESELGAFHLQVNELGAGWIELVEIVALEQRQLLKQHQSLRPWACLVNGVAAVIVADRRFD